MYLSANRYIIVHSRFIYVYICLHEIYAISMYIYIYSCLYIKSDCRHILIDVHLLFHFLNLIITICLSIYQKRVSGVMAVIIYIVN